MTAQQAIGSILHSFFCDYLKLQKGLRANSVKSYSDAMRLFLQFVSRALRRKITQLSLTPCGQLAAGGLQLLEFARGLSGQ